MRRPWLLTALTVLMSCAGAVSATPAIPPALEGWRDWVLHGYGEQRCPHVSEEATACRWPGELEIDADAQGLRFVQTWSIYAPQRVPLPGGSRWRPSEVEVDGRVAAIAFDEEGARIDLEPGTHRVSGRIAWSRRPPTLPVPAEIALVTLRVDGKRIELPQRNEEDELVLGATEGAEGDALQIEAYRLLADGAPAWFATRIVLSVAGKPREQLLGPILPAGYVPVALDGEIPLRWEPDGRLRVQLRAGDWGLTVIARAPAATTEFVWPGVPEPWTAQELWQFRADPHFRIAQLEGVPAVDPEQAVAPDWNEGLGPDTAARWSWLFQNTGDLPTYLFADPSKATLAVSLRGLPEERPSRLNLTRDLWLDFDGDEFVARDRVSGDLGGAARLDMRAPWRLEQAQRDGDKSLLVTQGSDAELSGVEWRDRQVNFESGSRILRDGAVPASGWTHTFDSAQTVLHLPPGYRLLGARGVDNADGSWTSRWSLLDMFLASLVLLLAWRLKSLLLPGLLLGWLLWSWHEPDAPQITLLLLLGLTLALRFIPAGRWQSITRWTQRGTFALVIFWGLWFAAGQLRLALHPQLEHGEVSAASGYVSYGSSNDIPEAVFMEAAEAPMPASAPAAPPPPPQRMAKARQEVQQQVLERIEVTGSRINKMDVFAYPADAIPQAGSARPDWSWHRHVLSWSGPLAPDEALDLWVSPPWLTRLLRVLAVGLFGAALVWLLRTSRGVTASPAPTPNASGAAAAMLLLCVAAAPPMARAQATPDPALLDALRERLLQRDEPCRPDCAGLASVHARREGTRAVLSLDAQALAEVAWPLPAASEGQMLLAVQVDGVAAAVRHDDAGDWVHLQRGVHRVEAVYGSDDGRWRLSFPLSPASVAVSEGAFEVAGLDEERLIGDTLELTAQRSADATESDPAPVAQDVPPFVKVVRQVVLDQQWTVITTVRRIAPARGGLTIEVPLLPGELPLGNAPPQREGRALVSLAGGAEEVSWNSRLTPAATYELVATTRDGLSEEWSIDPSPLLHVETAGLPESGQPYDTSTHRFLPFPGEKLTLNVTRPTAVEGATLAIENVRLHVTPGQRARDSRLEFTLRATRAGQHVLKLPEQSELLGLWIDGVEQPRLLNDGGVTLPLRTAPQNVVLAWREPVTLGLRMQSPALDLGVSAANLRIEIKVPEKRWLLAASGPGVGPALLYWSQLALLVIVAWALARHGGTPLRFHHWLLLGLGFSAVSWIAALIVGGWLLLLGWRGRRRTPGQGYAFALGQIALGMATAIALLCLIAAVPAGLLSTPDMQVSGNGSWGGQLNWFLDRSDGDLPVASAWSLPMWAYQVAILLWALWLANALLGWLRWGWTCFSVGGRWHWPRRVKAAPTPEASAPAATPPAAPSAAAPDASAS